MTLGLPPSLAIHLWERAAGHAVHGTAGSTVLARARTWPHAAQGCVAGLLLHDPAPHTWTWDWGFEEDVPVPPPTVTPTTHAGETLLHARYHDGTVLVGCPVPDGRAWMPFALELSDRDWKARMDEVLADIPRIWAYAQTLPPLATAPRQGPFDANATFTPHVEVGGPWPDATAMPVRAAIALATAWLQEAAPTLGFDPPTQGVYVARAPRVGGRWTDDHLVWEGLLDGRSTIKHDQAAAAVHRMVRAVMEHHGIAPPHWAGPLRAATGAKAIARAGACDDKGSAHFHLRLEAEGWKRRLEESVR